MSAAKTVPRLRLGFAARFASFRFKSARLLTDKGHWNGLVKLEERAEGMG